MAGRRAAFITGARSEYDILYPVIHACREGGRVDPAVIAGAGHLSQAQGKSVDLIRDDGVDILATIDSLVAADSWEARASSFGRFFDGVCNALTASRPDLVIVAGDREEALAGALAGNFLRIPVAHLFGGDRCNASDIDEVFRPAISKLSHLHFAATETHRQRLIKMGERPGRVWTVGATSLDRFRETPFLTPTELAAKIGGDVQVPYFLVIQHPTPTLGIADSGAEMATVLNGVLALGRPVFCIYPNFDPGNVAMREAIEKMAARSDKLHLCHTLSRDIFVNLFRHCAALVGNSSSIVIEAAFLKVAGILVGPRQDFREIGPNVMSVALDEGEISAACRTALTDAEFRHRVATCPSLYGDGASASRVASILGEIPLDQNLLNKMMCY